MQVRSLYFEVASAIDTRQNNGLGHQTTLFTVGRISRGFYRFLESRDSFIALLTAATEQILNNQLYEGAFILYNNINDIKEGRL